MDDSLTFKRGLTLKNRSVMAPMTIYMSFQDGKITTDELDYYSQRTGELGAVITAATMVQEDGKGFEGQPSAASDDMIPSLTKLAGRIKENGTKAILQLHHAGRISSKALLRGTQPVSAGTVKAYRDWVDEPREMSEEEIYGVIESFKEATIRAIKAGFDGVELHGANTYLIQQFFSPHSNQKTDQWGGSLEKRYHFIDLLVDEVTKVVDESDVENFIVGYRFSPEEKEEPGIRFDDTLYLVDQLSEKSLDYLHVSLRQHDQKSALKDYQEKSLLAYLYEKIDGRLPLISVGSILDGEDANNALENSDLFALGNAILMDPHWVQKAISGQDNLIRKEINKYDIEDLRLTEGALGTMRDKHKNWK